jgi:hypothetical protein
VEWMLGLCVGRGLAAWVMGLGILVEKTGEQSGQGRSFRDAFVARIELLLFFTLFLPICCPPRPHLPTPPNPFP